MTRTTMGIGIDIENANWLRKQKSITNTVNELVRRERVKTSSISDEAEAKINELKDFTEVLKHQEEIVKEESRKLRYMHFELDELKEQAKRVVSNAVPREAEGVHGVPEAEQSQ